MSDRFAKARAAKSAMGWSPYSITMRRVRDYLRDNGPTATAELARVAGMASGDISGSLAQAEKCGGLTSHIEKVARGPKGGKTEARVWRLA